MLKGKPVNNACLPLHDRDKQGGRGGGGWEWQANQPPKDNNCKASSPEGTAPSHFVSPSRICRWKELLVIFRPGVGIQFPAGGRLPE